MFDRTTARDSNLVVRSTLLFGLLALCFSTLQAGTVTLGGTEWTLSVNLIESENGTETYRVTLGADTANYTDTGTFISTVAIKISDPVVDMELISAPEGTSLANWSYLQGGLSGKGCSGKGGGWGCFDFASSDLVFGFGADVGGFVQWEFEVDIPEGKLLSELQFKADYVNSDGRRNGLTEGLVPNPEPGTLLLLGSGLLAGGSFLRKKFKG